MRLQLSDGSYTDVPNPREGDLIATQIAVYQVVEWADGELMGIALEDWSMKRNDGS